MVDAQAKLDQITSQLEAGFIQSPDDWLNFLERTYKGFVSLDFVDPNKMITHVQLILNPFVETLFTGKSEDDVNRKISLIKSLMINLLIMRNAVNEYVKDDALKSQMLEHMVAKEEAALEKLMRLQGEAALYLDKQDLEHFQKIINARSPTLFKMLVEIDRVFKEEILPSVYEALQLNGIDVTEEVESKVDVILDQMKEDYKKQVREGVASGQGLPELNADEMVLDIVTKLRTIAAESKYQDKLSNKR